MSTVGDVDISDQIDRLLDMHGVTTRAQLRRKLGLSKNTIRNWERAGRVPSQYLRHVRRPLGLLVAVAVLRDPQLTDSEARLAALTVLQQTEISHA